MSQSSSHPRAVNSRPWNGARSSVLARRAGCATGVEPLEQRTLLASIAWDGGGDGVSWSDPANWSTNSVPTGVDHVLIDAGASVTLGGKGGRIEIASLEAHGSITMRGGVLRTTDAMSLSGALLLKRNATLRAGTRLEFDAATIAGGNSLILLAPDARIGESASLNGLSVLRVRAGNELWFEGSASGRKVVLDGRGTARTVLTGTLDVSTSHRRESLGSVEILGADIYLHGASIDARGVRGAGEVRIGGDLGGGGTLPRAQRVYIDRDSRITANAMRNGDGGRVIVWSDEHTTFEGSITAAGGRLGGNGGFVETSARGILQVSGGGATARGRAGSGGTWLMDPYDILISASADFNVTLAPGDPTVFMGNGTGATVSTASIAAALNSGTSVTITTAGAGDDAGAILIADDIVKTGGGAATLSLIADSDVTLNANITSTFGELAILIQANGVFTAPIGSINTNGGQMQIVSVGFQLGAAASLSSQGGNFALVSFGAMTLDGLIDMGTGYGNIEAVSGDLNALTSINASGVQIRAYSGSVAVKAIEAVTILIQASDNIVLGSSGGGMFTAYSFLEAHAGEDGTGNLSFGPLVEVHAWQVRLRAGDGSGGAVGSSVNVTANSPRFRHVSGGATTPEFLTIRQDAPIVDSQIPSPSAFGGMTMPENLSLRSDDGSLTITSPAKVLGLNLTVAAQAAISLGVTGLTMMPASLTFDNTPTVTNIGGILQTTVGGLTFTSNVALSSPAVAIASPSTIVFQGTINGASSLNLTAPGLKRLFGATGNTTSLAALTITGGTAQLFSNVTAGTVTINSAATVFYTVTIIASTAGPVFQSTLRVDGSDELSIRGASPQFLGGADSVMGEGTIGIAPANNAASIQVGGAGFVSSTILQAIAPGFALVEFGSASHTGNLLIIPSTFRNPTRFMTGTGTITQQTINVTGGGGVSIVVLGATPISSQGNISTEGGEILIDANVYIDTANAHFLTTQAGATAGADIHFTRTVIPGDGQVPFFQANAGTMGVVSFDAGLGSASERFDTLLVYGGPDGAVRSFGDIWLGNAPGSGFFTESPFELGSDLSVSARNAGFFNGVRSFGALRSLQLSGGEQVEFHGAELRELIQTSPSGLVHFVQNITVTDTCSINADLRVEWYITVSAGSLTFGRTIDLNGFDLGLVADNLNLGGNVLGGNEVSTLEIKPRSAAQDMSINDIDEGLWLSTLALSRIQGGLQRLILGSLTGTATLSIGSATFSDPVEFRMAGPGGSIELNGPLVGVGNASFSFVGSGSTLTLYGNVSTQSQPIDFDDAIVIGASAVSISTTGGETQGADIRFRRTVDSQTGAGNSLNLSAGIGNVIFEGEVGGQPGGQLGALFIDSGGGLTLLDGGLLRSLNGQTHLRDIHLGANAAIDGGTGTLVFVGAIVCGAHDLLLRADDMTILAAVSGSGHLHISPFSLSRDVNINISPLGPGGALTIDPAEKSRLQDGFASVIFGQEGQMSSMVIGGGDFSDPTSFVSTGPAGTSEITVAGDINGTDNGGIRIRGGGSTTHLFGSIRTEGNTIEVFDSIVIHFAGLALDSTFGGYFPIGAYVEVDGKIDSTPGDGNDFVLRTGMAGLRIGGAIGSAVTGRLGSLTVDALGQTVIAAGLIRTIGFQLYAGPVLVPVDLVISTLGAPITFEDEVLGEENVTIDEGSGETTFNQPAHFESLTIQLGSTRTFNGEVTIGLLTILGGSVYFNAPGFITNGTLVSGVFSGDADASIEGEFTWLGGLIEGAGRLILLPTGTFALDAGSSRTLARDIRVEGRLHWVAGNLTLLDATIEVTPGGVLEVSSSGTVLAAPTASAELLNNGRIERNVPGAGAFVGLNITSTGEIDVAAGSIKFTPRSGTFTNQGEIVIGPAGSLIVRGEFVQDQSGSLSIHIAGTGVAQFGRLLVINSATLDGRITTAFVDGFVPHSGDEFKFLSAEHRAGTFSSESLQQPGGSLTSRIEYLNDGAKLVIAPRFAVDFDQDGERTVADIFAFLSAWFAGDADFDGDGQTTVADIFAYLSAWFAG